MLTAASLLARTGLAAQYDLMAPRLVEAASSLARLAAAVPPAQRLAWGGGHAWGRCWVPGWGVAGAAA